MKRAVFLDRDGVINGTVIVDGVPKPPRDKKEVAILEGVVEAIQLLRDHDYVPVVVTNQPDVARGTTTESNVNILNSHIGKMTNIEFFYTCFHDDIDLCDCRKPSPGLIKRAATELSLDIPNSYLVGDRWRDIAAAQAAGCQSFFIDYSYPELNPKMPYVKVFSLLEAVQIMIGVKYARKHGVTKN
jgi:D-glycero-D-manno-heptose 1,7-bisphosphate phosphatase